ncbi:serine hydrolase-like protein isoform X3 [Diorhabda sublineata]|uniref:serine hydrolase-like protein isoform X3 n=1 Tax=Diorhabda sublineata TaxID=1163346 RepID=UPI0024E1953B|nr:serine hydrolase-like protein isoform X3 [Diorhabda sublineata]
MTSNCSTNTKQIGEIEIPVPWGYVAAKTWGKESDPLILCLHGIMDNAGSFDKLIPLLPSSYYYVCIDLPGHGRSSQFPPHLPLQTINFLLVYKEASRYFKRKFIIMGHSYGGKLGFFYAQMYPEFVDKLILLESTNFYPVSSDNYIKYLNDKTNSYFKINDILKSKKPPKYTLEEALDRVQNNRSFKPVERDVAEALLARAIEPVGARVKFTLDQRIKNFIDPLRDHRYMRDCTEACPIKCPALIILGKESTHHKKIMGPFIKLLEAWKNVVLVVVEGGHDVHNEYPERIAFYINKFLLKNIAKL